MVFSSAPPPTTPILLFSPRLDKAAFHLPGTDPRDATSVLALTNLTRAADGTLTVQWPSVAARTYTLKTCTDLATGTWTPIAIGITAPPTHTYTARITAPTGFVRVVVV